MSSKEGLRRRSEAGARNLERWKAAHPGRSNYRHGLFAELGRQVPDEVKRLLDEFEDALREELGGSISPVERALIHSARVSYCIVLLGEKYFTSEKVEPGSVRERRRKGLVSVLTTISNHQTGLLRNLHALGIHNKRVRSSDENLEVEVDNVLQEIRSARGMKHAEAAEPR